MTEDSNQPWHLTQRGIQEAIETLSITRIQLGKFFVQENKSALTALNQRHHLAGLVTETVFFATLPDNTVDDKFKERIVVFPWGWPGHYGATLTISILFSDTSEPARISIPQDELKRLCKSFTTPITLVLVRGQHPVTAYSIDFANHQKSSTNIQAHIASVTEHTDVILNDERVHYWEVLSRQDVFRKRFTSSDLLSLGWYESFDKQAIAAERWILDVKIRLEKPSGNWIPDVLLQLLTEIYAGKSSLNHILSLLNTTFEGVGSPCVSFVHDWITCLPAFVEQHEELTHLVALIFSLHLASSRNTDCGKQLVWYDCRSNTFKQLSILPNQFPAGCDPKEYWPRLPFDLINFGRGIGVDGGDFPINPASLIHDRESLPIAMEVESVTASAEALMDEAIENKIGTIPPNAHVDLKFGPFNHLEITECDPNVFFVCRNTLGEILQISLEPRRHYCSFQMPSSGNIEPNGVSADKLNAGVKMLLAAIVRDFWVVERRETVFDSRVHRSSETQGRSVDDDTPRIVYVPRIRYETKINSDKCSESLGLTGRRVHGVRGFVRKVSTPSPHQLALAQRYGIDVPTGYTFVRPHQRGNSPRSVIYRSRSALQCLYVSQDVTTGAAPSLWFQFECDVRKMMEKFGFSVQHVSLSRRGDNGIDVYATKGTDLDAIEWVIQCKCWRSNRRVYPATVRELLGTLQRYPRGTRGMIVTTSGFSTGAVTTAQEGNIRLIDGEEFARLTQ